MIVGSTFIVSVGHKCKDVGVVGVFAPNNPAQPFTLRYQLVPLSGDFQTPPDKEKGHPILDLMEEYTQELKKYDYLAHYGKSAHPVQFAVRQMPKFKGVAVEYAGSAACQNCHKHAYKIWHASAHATAYKTLVNAKRPGLRQYDGECIVCHTVGFAYKGGFTDHIRTEHLENVGCESCHGPSKLHVQNPNNKALRALINPWKAKRGETPDEHTNACMPSNGTAVRSAMTRTMTSIGTSTNGRKRTLPIPPWTSQKTIKGLTMP